MHSTGPGTVYLIHLDTPYKHARHYTGWTTDLDARLQAHRNGQGARLMKVITKAGITWRLARPGPADDPANAPSRTGTKHPGAPMLAPPRPVSTGRSAILPAPAHRGLAATAPRPAAASAALPVPERHPGGRAVHHRPGRMDRPAADRLPPYITGPFRERTRHTPAEQEWFRGYTEPITRRITQLTTAEPRPALDSDSEHALRRGGHAMTPPALIAVSASTSD